MDRWTSWAGESVGKPNLFVNQVLGVMESFTGVPPPFRVGADSEDRGYIQPGVAVINSSFPAATTDIPFPEANTVGIGKDFYALSSNLPKGTSFIWGVNLKARNVSETVAQVALLADTFQGSRKALMANVTLTSLEIGNEPDFFAFPGWTPSAYVEIWSTIVNKVTSIIKLGGRNEPTLEGPAFAGFASGEWDAMSVLNAGFRDGKAGKLLGTFGEHHYSGVHAYPSFSPEPKIGDLLNKNSIRSNMTRHAKEVSRARSVGLPYILGETNSYANHGAPGVSNTAEAAIWMVDNALQAASVGVQQMYFHHGVGYRYNLFQPISGADDGVGLTSRPHVLPVFYGALVVNEAIGTSGNSCVAEIGTDSATVSAYGIYEQSKLARIVVINSEMHLPSQNSTRMNSTVYLDGLGDNIHFTAKRLSIPFTNATSGLTWASVNYDTASGVPEGKPVQEDVTGAVSVAASEVVLLCLK
ncbi:hypothetical protein QFC24_004620 [Naganishia onofrii]|uniref:Uncharacterized protein n=1 Tax=Naganishia onofrii TaxID=1851511 RepID=A0ACC2XB74_9TREE|nr:hypothetical protein QFC24_004620 [Naganishia onofrii]